jgi:hypothetical protein
VQQPRRRHPASSQISKPQSTPCHATSLYLVSLLLQLSYLLPQHQAIAAIVYARRILPEQQILAYLGYPSTLDKSVTKVLLITFPLLFYLLLHNDCFIALSQFISHYTKPSCHSSWAIRARRSGLPNLRVTTADSTN